MPWNHKAYASATDPARQSDLNDVASPHGCSRRFWYKKTEQADGVLVQRQTASWKLAHGSVIHKIIERALSGWPRLRAAADKQGPAAIRSAAIMERLGQIYDEELPAAADGLPIDWRDASPTSARAEACVMAREVLVDLLERIERPLAVEAPFADSINGYHTTGTIDLVYEPRGRPGEVGFADWKSGQMRVHPVILAHGYQVAIYAHAIEHAVFWPAPGPGAELDASDPRRGMRFGAFPSEIHIVHLRELLPYAKRTTFTLERDEEIAWARELAAKRGLLEAIGGAERVARGARVEIEPSTTPPPKLKKDGTPYKRPARANPPLLTLQHDRRGPAWYAAPRTPADVARLRVSLASIVGTVRLGRFYESVGEQCERCPFRGPCLTEGHAVAKDEMVEINRALRGVDGLDALMDYAV